MAGAAIGARTAVGVLELPRAAALVRNRPRARLGRRPPSVCPMRREGERPVPPGRNHHGVDLGGDGRQVGRASRGAARRPLPVDPPRNRDQRRPDLHHSGSVLPRGRGAWSVAGSPRRRAGAGGRGPRRGAGLRPPVGHGEGGKAGPRQGRTRRRRREDDGDGRGLSRTCGGAGYALRRDRSWALSSLPRPRSEPAGWSPSGCFWRSVRARPIPGATRSWPGIRVRYWGSAEHRRPSQREPVPRAATDRCNPSESRSSGTRSCSGAPAPARRTARRRGPP